MSNFFDMTEFVLDNAVLERFDTLQEAVTFAIIKGYSQHPERYYTQGVNNLAELVKVTPQEMMKILDTLIQKHEAIACYKDEEAVDGFCLRYKAPRLSIEELVALNDRRKQSGTTTELI